MQTIIEVSTTKAPRKRKRTRKLKASEIIDRKGRRVGSDDLMGAANVCKFAEHGGLHRNLVQVACSVGIGLEAAVQLALRGEHREAGKKAQNVLYVLNKEINAAIGNLKVDCRDSKIRKVIDMTKWFVGVHLRIADEIEEARAEEDERELERLQIRASRLAQKEAEAAVPKAEVVAA